MTPQSTIPSFFAQHWEGSQRWLGMSSASAEIWEGGEGGGRKEGEVTFTAHIRKTLK